MFNEEVSQGRIPPKTRDFILQLITNFPFCKDESPFIKIKPLLKEGLQFQQNPQENKNEIPCSLPVKNLFLND